MMICLARDVLLRVIADESQARAGRVGNCPFPITIYYRQQAPLSLLPRRTDSIMGHGPTNGWDSKLQFLDSYLDLLTVYVIHWTREKEPSAKHCSRGRRHRHGHGHTLEG